MNPEKIKFNIIFLIYPIAALVLLLWQMNFRITPIFTGASGKLLSTLILVLSGVSVHLLQGPFQQFANLLTAATALYLVGNFMPNYGMGVPAFRNAANSADLSPAVVAQISARVLFLVLGLFTVLYLFFAFLGSDIVFLPTAMNAYHRIVKMEPSTSSSAMM